MPQFSEVRDLIPLQPHLFEILLCLDRAPMHGYRIIGDICERTDGGIELSTSTLYGGIRRLLRDGLVEDAGNRSDEGSGGPPRRYYCITERGRSVARLEAERVQRVAQVAARQLLRHDAGLD